MVFANPTYLYLLLLLIPMIGWYIWKLCKSQASLQVSSSEAFDAPGSFTAKDVQQLRERTGVGMMDCKKALTETDGDMEKAIDILREKGLAAAAKKSGDVG